MRKFPGFRCTLGGCLLSWWLFVAGLFLFWNLLDLGFCLHSGFFYFGFRSFLDNLIFWFVLMGLGLLVCDVGVGVGAVRKLRGCVV